MPFYFEKILIQKMNLDIFLNPENELHVYEPLVFILYCYVIPDHRDSLKGQEVKKF